MQADAMAGSQSPSDLSSLELSDLSSRSSSDLSSQTDGHEASRRSSAVALNVGNNPRADKKDDFVATFERKLNRVSWLAIVEAGLQNLVRFLGFCALTWASVALLGGLISNLGERDFYLTTFLVLLEGTRFVANVFFSNLVTRKLETFSSNPSKRHGHDGKRKHLIVAIRFVGPACQLLFVSPSIALPVLALRSVHYQNGTFDSTSASLYIFYNLVLLNACFAASAVLYPVIISLYLPKLSGESTDESLQRYFDEFVWRGVDKGLLQVNDFDFLAFAFKVQAQEYSRRAHARSVGEKYRNLIRYLAKEPTGVEAACIALDSADPYHQQAAANIVGLWTKLDEGKKLPYQTQLLSKLADKINLGQTGWAAANSFHMLGEQNPATVFKVENQRGKKVVRVFIDEIDPSNSWSMICVRAMLPLVKTLGESKIGKKKITEFNEKLRKILCSDERRARERISAAYALHLQGESFDKRILEGMKMKKGEYMLKEEMDRLEEMLVRVPDGCKDNEVKDYSQKDWHLPRQLSLGVGALVFGLILGAIIVPLLYAYADKALPGQHSKG